MKTYEAQDKLYLTGKAWEIRYKLQRMSRKEALKHPTLQAYLNQKKA